MSGATGPTTTQTIQQELLALLMDAITEKPQNVCDALVLCETLEFALAKWVVSELPVAEQKMVLAEKWAASKASAWCSPKK